MSINKNKITCCKGDYHVLVDDTYYCMAPPNIDCQQMRKDAGKFTRGVKKILYCSHQVPCADCQKDFGNPDKPNKKQKD
jgi:hypothetical protein